MELVKERLMQMGYERMGVVEARGEYSIRGGILDIYTPDGEYPYRIELFGTEVDSIRTFNIATQRSVENLKFVEIYPAEQVLLEKDQFRAAAENVRKEYTPAAKRVEKQSEETAEKLRRRRDELCEYIEQVANVQLLENYLHYFYDETEYLWDYMEKGWVMVDDPDRIYEALDLRTRELREDFSVLLERGQVIPKDEALLSD